jgi:RNA polymerase sigma-70 factor (ECF subfamily)
LRQAVTLCGNLTLAEDLVQDTLVEAWKYLRRYNGRCQFFTWLCAILLNRYRNALRKNCLLPVSTLGRRDQDEFEKHTGNLADHAALPDQAVELREQAVLVRQCVQALPAKHQQVIYLRFYVDDSLESIAVVLGCSVGTVKSRLFHALEKLRKMNAFSAQLSDFKTKGGIL